MELIIAAILGAACGFGIAWLIIRKMPQDKIREINYENLQAEKELFERQQKVFEARKRQNEAELLEIELRRKKSQQECEENILTNNQKIDNMLREVNALQIKKETLGVDITHMTAQREDISKNLEQSKIDAEKTAKTFLNQQMALACEQLDREVEQAALQCQDQISSYNNIYFDTMRECVQCFQEQLEEATQRKNALENELSVLQSAVDAAVAAAKRDEEKRQEQNFYRLVIPESDLHEIAQLRAVEPFLRDREALNKVIWKVYYEKPYTDMIGRVIGSGIKTGIYKITNLENQMCYVGQAADVASRWRQHIKRGLGAEAPTRNKLYPAMSEFGVENFTFELLEECGRDTLDAREDYWQDFYHAKDFGYSIK